MSRVRDKEDRVVTNDEENIPVSTLILLYTIVVFRDHVTRLLRGPSPIPDRKCWRMHDITVIDDENDSVHDWISDVRVFDSVETDDEGGLCD